MRIAMRVASATLGSLLLSIVVASCHKPTLDERLRMDRRELPQRAPITGVRNTDLNSATAMYAAAELLRTSAPYYDRFTELNLTQEISPENETAFRETALWLARYNVETLDWISGMGIPLPESEARLAALLRASGLEASPIRNPLPIQLPFISGDPHFTQKVDLGDTSKGLAPDAATMRFDPRRMDRTLGGDSIGFTMWAEVELARLLLSGAHATEGSGEGLAPGRRAEDQFYGLLLLSLAAEKARTLQRLFSMTADESEGPYLPHRVTPEGDATWFSVVDPISYLGDLAATLLAASELANVSSPSKANPLAGVFGANGPLPADTHALAAGVARSALAAIVSRHEAPDRKAPASYASDGERSQQLRVSDAALTAVALRSYDRNIERGVIEVESLARRIYGFLLASQYDDGAYSSAFDVETLDAIEPRDYSATVQGLAIRGLLVAFEATGDFQYRRAALRTVQYLDEEMWVSDLRLYRSEEIIAKGTKFSRYRPELVGAIASALRELSIVTRDAAYAHRCGEFINVITKTGLLLSEREPTGETSSEALDLDTDGIFNAPFADGRFGVAPVFATEVVYPTR